MDLIKNLKWRYATKYFDPYKKVPKNDIEKIKQAIQLSASSYGLQLYTILIIENQVMKDQLKPVSWNQSQISDASHLFIFCNYTEAKNEHIDNYLKLKSDLQGVDITKLKGYGDFIKSKLNAMKPHEFENWTARQTYIALGNLMNACAELKIDTCPVEGFERDQYNLILGLKQKGLSASVIAAVGYRKKSDQSQFATKVRKPIDSLFEFV